MKIKETELYKYLDILLSESEITEPNSSKNILHEKYLNPISNEEKEKYFEICNGVIILGVKLGYFNYISKETDWFDLTEKGISAKSKGGHLKYVDYIEQKESERNKPTIIAENYIGGNNQGIQASNINLKIKQQNQPIQQEIGQSPIISFLLKFWWQVLIPLSIIIVGILIEKKIINIGI